MDRPLNWPSPPISTTTGQPVASDVSAASAGGDGGGGVRSPFTPHRVPPSRPEPSRQSPQSPVSSEGDQDSSLRHPPARKKVTAGKNDELHAAIDRQAIAEQKQAVVRNRSQHQPSHMGTASPTPPAAPKTSPSPPASPARMSSSKESTVRPDRGGGAVSAHRTASIDSAISNVSSTTPGPQRSNGSNRYRVPQDAAGPQDAAALIVAAGSAEAALQKLISEKQQAASHNSQLWRLVEKQRAMILGLNKDLEKSLKDKERYRKRLKDHLAQSTSAPALMTTARRPDVSGSQDTSPSSSHPDRPPADSRDISVDTKRTIDSSEVTPSSAHWSDTPQDANNLASTGSPTTPQTASSSTAGTLEMSQVNAAIFVPVSAQAGNKTRLGTARQIPSANTATASPQTAEVVQIAQAVHGHQKSISVTSIQASSPSAQLAPSPKTRKAPPAPLKLGATKPDPSIANNIIDASDSEYEENPESARSEHMERGRRKTREEDDREREEIAREEEEHRSRSKKEKKSRSGPSTDKIDEVQAPPVPKEPVREAPRQPPAFDALADPADIIRHRVASDAAGGVMQRSTTAPSLLSPGLPMSPRPGDRPPNSPMPRAPHPAINSIPMSPKAGLPLSPRAPRQPIPLPPQTPLAVISPHLDRAKTYHHQMQAQTQLAPGAGDHMKSSPNGTPENDPPSISSDLIPSAAGDVYQGLVSEHYPGLLLPPNALPSIYVKTASSRMKPSRASYIQPKLADDNPVFTLAIHERSDNKQLWRSEKTFAALQALDQQVRAMVVVYDRLPDKQLFAGHAPAKIDARRIVLNAYFERLLDSVNTEKAAMIVCRFLSADTVGSESSEYFSASIDGRPDSPISSKLRPNMAGYLTKRGKNFGGWKARYFVLDGPSLKYFEGRGGAHLGSIKLQNAQIGKQSPNNNQAPQDDEDNQFRHAFLILEPRKKDSSSLVRHVLCAESDEERDIWVEALLQYVDYRDDEDQIPARQAQVSKTDISGPRSPRLQKSTNDLRSGTAIAAQTVLSDPVRSVGYTDTVAGEAPVMGPPLSPRVAQPPSPPSDKVQSGQAEYSAHPTISGPINLHVIQNAGDWGMKQPPTPGGKDKKRGMFSNLPFTRGRSSSDLAPSEVKTTPYAPSSVRGVFGVPLAEAVVSAHPADATTELPAVVFRCIEYLTAQNAIAEEGIFRLSGSNTVIKSLKERFNNEGDVNLLADGNYYDVHAVASLLKLYLRELPASILTRDLHLDFLHCLELPGDEKVVEVNKLVNKLPGANRALLEALSAFMLLIVDNVGVNKMNVRNLGVVFSPTLNLPGPLISLFVEEQRRIFGPAFGYADSMTSSAESASQATSNDLRSPRKQMFSELPTPAYHQTQFQSFGGTYHHDDTGMIPMHPTYGQYQMAPQGEGGFGSLNDALRSPTVYGTTGTGEPTPRDIKAKRRESGMLVVNNASALQKKASASRLREGQSTSF